MTQTIQQKLESLVSLQKIDSSLDDIKKVRGALPEEAQDLEDEVARLQTRLDRKEEEGQIMEKELAENKNIIKTAEEKIKRYEEQQENIRNNREFEAIAKELEYEQLEIEHAEKKNQKIYTQIETIEAEKKEISHLIQTQNERLVEKRNELNAISDGSALEEKELLEKREKALQKVDNHLCLAYEKIRKSARNGLAVVSVKRGACGGCFNAVPPQRQTEILEKKKLIVCEHCGRIFAEVVLEEKPVKKRASRQKA